MRLRISCMRCLQEDGHPSDESTSVELRDDGLYKATCSRGHVSVTAIQEQKFEVLFDLGAMALLDGYPREAVSSFAASLERFLEYYVRVVSVKHGIEAGNFSNAWELVSKQSERQLGSFIFMYLIENGSPVTPFIFNSRPKLKNRSKGNILTWSGFRNKVIHQGYIPSTDDVISYADLLFNWMHDIIRELKDCCADSMNRVTSEHLQRSYEVASGQATTTMSIPTLISLVRDRVPEEDFKDALTKLEKYKLWLYHQS